MKQQLLLFSIFWNLFLLPFAVVAAELDVMQPDSGGLSQNLWRWGLYAAVAGIVAAGLFAIWNRSLKKEIGRREVTEDALVSSILQYQNLLKTIPHGVVEIDKYRQITYSNQPFTELLGYEPYELMGEKLDGLIVDSPTKKTFLQLLAKAVTNGPQQSFTLQLLDKNKQKHEVRFDCDFSQQGTATGQIIVVTDQTRQQQIEVALSKSESIYRSTFENIQAGVAHLTASGQFSRANKFLCQLLEYTEAELLEKNVRDITHPYDRDSNDLLWQKLLEQKTESYSIAKRYLKKSGQAIWVLMSIAALAETENDERFVMLIQDIDELKQQQDEVAEKSLNLEVNITQRTAELQKRVTEVEELNDAMLNLTEDLQRSHHQLESQSDELTDVNKELESFAYSVSHDLRAPLRHVQGFADILLESSVGELSTTNRKHLTTIMESASRMGRLIDDLLAFSRAGRSELQQRPIETGLIVKEVVAGLSDANVGREINWHIGELPVVVGDLGALRQVFANLLDNAVKYSSTRPVSKITVCCEQTPIETIFTISDNGVGFDPEYAHKLFGVFNRLHRADQFEGSGIGLANVKRIVKRHGGRVWAETGEEGASFFFSLPNSQGT